MITTSPAPRTTTTTTTTSATTTTTDIIKTTGTVDLEFASQKIVRFSLRSRKYAINKKKRK